MNTFSNPFKEKKNNKENTLLGSKINSNISTNTNNKNNNSFNKTHTHSHDTSANSNKNSNFVKRKNDGEKDKLFSKNNYSYKLEKNSPQRNNAFSIINAVKNNSFSPSFSHNKNSSSNTNCNVNENSKSNVGNNNRNKINEKSIFDDDDDSSDDLPDPSAILSDSQSFSFEKRKKKSSNSIKNENKSNSTSTNTNTSKTTTATTTSLKSKKNLFDFFKSDNNKNNQSHRNNSSNDNSYNRSNKDKRNFSSNNKSNNSNQNIDYNDSKKFDNYNSDDELELPEPSEALSKSLDEIKLNINNSSNNNSNNNNNSAKNSNSNKKDYISRKSIITNEKREEDKKESEDEHFSKVNNINSNKNDDDSDIEFPKSKDYLLKTISGNNGNDRSNDSENKNDHCSNKNNDNKNSPKNNLISQNQSQDISNSINSSFSPNAKKRNNSTKDIIQCFKSKTGLNSNLKSKSNELPKPMDALKQLISNDAKNINNKNGKSTTTKFHSNSNLNSNSDSTKYDKKINNTGINFAEINNNNNNIKSTKSTPTKSSLSSSFTFNGNNIKYDTPIKNKNYKYKTNYKYDDDDSDSDGDHFLSREDLFQKFSAENKTSTDRDTKSSLNNSPSNKLKNCQKNAFDILKQNSKESIGKDKDKDPNEDFKDNKNKSKNKIQNLQSSKKEGPFDKNKIKDKQQQKNSLLDNIPRVFKDTCSNFPSNSNSNSILKYNKHDTNHNNHLSIPVSPKISNLHSSSSQENKIAFIKSQSKKLLSKKSSNKNESRTENSKYKNRDKRNDTGHNNSNISDKFLKKISNPTISKSKINSNRSNSYSSIINHKNRNKKRENKNKKPSLQLILPFYKSKGSGEYSGDKADFENIINNMEKIFENQESITSTTNMIMKSLEESENPSKKLKMKAKRDEDDDENIFNEDRHHSIKRRKHIHGNSLLRKILNEDKEIKNKMKDKAKSVNNKNDKNMNSIEQDQDISSLSCSQMDSICRQQIETLKELDKEFDESEYDEESYNFNTFEVKPRRRRINLEDYFKSCQIPSLRKRNKNIINNSWNHQDNKATFKCPYCQYEYYETIDNSVYNELQQFLEDNHMKNREGEIISFNVPILKQYEFCRLHQAKLVIIPEGIKKGYPLHIDFDQLSERIHCFKDDLFHIVYGRKKSYFRELALSEYKRLGTNKARNSTALINRYEKILVGYYGSKGFNIITEILQDIFFVKRHSTLEEDSTLENPNNYDSNANSHINFEMIVGEKRKLRTEIDREGDSDRDSDDSNSDGSDSDSGNSSDSIGDISSSDSSDEGRKENINYKNMETTILDNRQESINEATSMTTSNAMLSDEDNGIPNSVVKTEKILTYELSKPQEPFEFIQEVLVPECGVRLIAEDQHLDKDNEEDFIKARKIMEESNDFGLIVHEFSN